MPVDRQRLKERAFERRWTRAGKDLCQIIAIEYADDGAGGIVPTETVLESNAPILYEPKGQAVSLVAGGQSVVLTHDLTLKPTDSARAIKPHYVIRVVARGNRSEMLFENLLNQDGSSALLVKLGASVKV